jgi:protein-tyrosine phosphatase
MTVCTGNICRSPIAEVVLRDRFEAAGLGAAVEVDSTGISAEEDGNPIDRRAAAVLARHGYDTAGAHRARPVAAGELRDRDLVLPMTSVHARALRRLAGADAADGDADAAQHIRMYRSFDPAAPRLAPGQREDPLDIEDPWFGGDADFEECLAQVEAAADGVVDHVRAALAARARATAG